VLKRLNISENVREKLKRICLIYSAFKSAKKHGLQVEKLVENHSKTTG
jgi:hypothetical protein